MSKGGRPALDMLGQELRRGEEDYGAIDGSEQLAVFSHPDAPGRPREGRKAIQDILAVLAGGEAGGISPSDAIFSVVSWSGATIPYAQQSALLDVFIGEALVGARVEISYAGDLQGCFTHGYVKATGSVNCYIANLTGTEKTLGGAQLYITIWNTDPQHPPGSEGHLLLEDGAKIRLEAA